MNPLFEKYFLSELNDSEESMLEKLLLESPDSAWEFGQAAEETYIRYGLPEPKLPQGPGGGFSGGMNPRLWLWPGLGLLVVGTSWLWNQRLAQAPLPDSQAVAPPAFSVPAKIEVQGAVTPPALKIQATPTMELPPGGDGEKVKGNNLRVVVHPEKAGPVTVKVVQAGGSEVRRLYSGILQAGRWPFDWDGRAEDGRFVDPGKYRIEVEAGGVTQSREVIIH